MSSGKARETRAVHLAISKSATRAALTTLPPVPHAAPLASVHNALQQVANGIHVAHLNQNCNELRWSIDVQYASMLDNMVAITVACQSHAGEPVMLPALAGVLLILPPVPFWK